MLVENTRRSINLAIAWMRGLATPETSAHLAGQSARRLRTAMCCGVFLLALGVRVLYFEDNRVDIERGKSFPTGLEKHYQYEARRIASEGGVLIPREAVAPGDVRLIVHPPGYSILMAALLRFGDPDSALILIQIFCDALAAVLVLLVASQMLPVTAAMFAALLAALFPHSSYYSVWQSPDTLAVAPILLAVYLIGRLCKHPRLATAIASGALIGVSCWLRANAFLMAPLLAMVMFVLLERGRRLRHSMAFVAASLVVISPITIRNAIIYHQFIPISVGSGITLIEGIADYDRQGRFGMPQHDRDVANKDAEWHGRSDYAGNLWSPDGIERDRARFERGLGVVRENPIWFLGVMLLRAKFMLSYDNPNPPDWPFNTVSVPTVSAEPRVGHNTSLSAEALPAAELTPTELMTNGNLESSSAGLSLDQDPESLQVTGDDSAFGDQFSAPIAVNRNSDFLITVMSTLAGGRAAIKVTSADRRIALASSILNSDSNEPARKERKANRLSADENRALNPMRAVELAFASGNRTEVRLVVSNNGAASERPIVKLGQVRAFELGATPHLWSRYPRAVIRGAQKNLFTTSRLFPCVLLGSFLLVLARRRRVLLILLAVPLYYLCVQSALHTEYRYILAIHYFLFVLAGTTLFCASRLIGEVAAKIAAYLKHDTANSSDP